MMNIEYLVIGQGISGSFLSWYLLKAGKSVLVIDKYDPFSASRVAAGIINPVTGRRLVTTWMIDTLMDFAMETYTQFGKELGLTAITQKNIIEFFPSPQMMMAFRERLTEDPTYLSIPVEQQAYTDRFNYDFEFGEISPCYAVNLAALLPAWRNELISRNQLIEEEFDHSLSSVTKAGVSYKDIRADKIIFCDGIQAATNPFFRNLPFAYNKGEALLIRSEGLPEDLIFKKGLLLAPMGKDAYWVGSSYEWNFADDKPSLIFLERTTNMLKNWLKHPFEIIDHLASVRPATIERRPFVGMHPLHPKVGVFNGMGTKGCSLAPFFANQLANHLVNNDVLMKEVSVERFSRILNM